MKTNYLIVLVIGIVVLNNEKSVGQWEPLDLGSPGRVNEVCVIGANIFAGTDAGTFRSTNEGADWSIVNSSFTLSITSQGTNIFIGTPSGVSLSTDHGNTWSSSGSIGWVDAFAVEGSEIFAGTNGNGVFRSTNAGTNWTIMNNGLEDYQVMVNALAISGTKILAGTAAGLCISTDDGDSWSTLVANDLSSLQYVNSITLSDSSVFVGTPGGIIRSTDNGTSWEKSNKGFPLDGSGFLPSIFCVTVDGADVFTGTTASVYLSTDGGDSWNQASEGLPTYPKQVFSIAATDGGLFASTYDGVFSSTDKGAHWVSSSNGIAGSGVGTIIGGGSFVYAPVDSSLFVSSDYGRTWRTSGGTFPGAYLQSLTQIGRSLFAVTNGGIYVSADSGGSWTTLNGGIMDTTYPTTIVQSGANLVVSTQDQGIFYSSDNGTSWKKTIGNLPPVILSLGAVGSAVYAGFYEGGLYRSTDEGKSWTDLDDTLYGVTSVVSVGSSLITARPPWAGPVLDHSYHYPGAVFRSTDDGESWLQLSSGLPFDPEVTPLFVHDSNIFLGIDGYGVCLSSDDGDQWTNIGEGLPSLSFKSIFVNDSTIFVNTEGGVWQRALSGITGVKQTMRPPIPAAFALYQNYPNPFNPTTTIAYQLQVNSFVTLKVYDILGREVAALENERVIAGTHSIKFDGAGLPSGVYLYRLAALGFVKSMKMILLK